MTFDSSCLPRSLSLPLKMVEMQVKYLRNATKGRWNLQRCQPIFACSFPYHSPFPPPLADTRCVQFIMCAPAFISNAECAFAGSLCAGCRDCRHLLIKVADFLHTYICIIYIIFHYSGWGWQQLSCRIMQLYRNA